MSIAGLLGLFCAGSCLTGVVGCKDLTGSQQLPAGTVNPSAYNTPVGAIGMRTAALYALEQAVPDYIIHSGLLTDELEDHGIGASPGQILVTSFPSGGSLDARILPDLTYGALGPADLTYNELQHARAYLTQAAGAIAAYDTGVAAIGDPRAMRAELYALQAYTEILLADLFCSGVPLSTLDFQADYTYHAGSTTAQVYHDARIKADSALALADTDTQVLNLARVIKGRALLALDSVAAAAEVVADVPDGFQYQLSIRMDASIGSYHDLLDLNGATVSDMEGGHGLPYISGGDPRTAVVEGDTNDFGVQLTFPARYSRVDFSPFVVADWIEARLIQAEGAYQGGGGAAAMLADLNALRRDALVQNQLVAAPDTLTDRGSDSANVALLFQERAYWFFLTGHRQGDLRRQVREYSRWFSPPDRVYPSGIYPVPFVGTDQYGADVTAPVPGNEYLNPLFHGCLDRDP